MNQSFGELVKKYRKGKSLKKLGDEIGITASYLSDIEKGNRFPSKKVLDEFIQVFQLKGKEKNQFYDLVAQECPNNYKVSDDIALYIMQNEQLRNFIRIAQEKNLNNKYWNNLIRSIEVEG